MHVIFPEKAGGLPKKSMFERYYRIYYGYILASLQHLDADIRFGPDSSIGDAKFSLSLNDVEVIIDYSDHLTLAPRFENYPLYFKFHYSEKHHQQHQNLLPFSPISFYDWKQYFQLKEEIQYNATGDLILNRQLPHGNAFIRRKKVQNLLRRTYGTKAKTQKTQQQAFWKEINQALIAVCVPGSRNNMLDRGQLQFLAFGACTISPIIITELSGFRKLIPNVHYIPCADDYSDLISKIEWCRNNRSACAKIGQNAQQLFLTTSTPSQLWTWVTQNMHARSN